MDKDRMVRQATFYASDEQEFDCFKASGKWFIYHSHVNTQKVLATFNHFPTHEEVMDECWEEDPADDTD